MHTAIVWFRQDLRLEENPAFINACNHSEVVIPLYIYDKKTSALGRAQAWWLHHSLCALSKSLVDFGLPLVLRQGQPQTIIGELIEQFSIDAVYWNRCYESQTRERDKKIESLLSRKGILVKSSNANLLTEPWTIKNKQGMHFKVFTPYWKTCLQAISIPLPIRPRRKPQRKMIASDKLDEWQLLPRVNWASQFAKHWQPGEEGAAKKLANFINNNLQGYRTKRDFPAKEATSRLSPHLHFGEISPWALWRAVALAKIEETCDLASAECFLTELGWREFSTYLLYHFPNLYKDNFRKEFAAFPWNKDEASLRRWQQGMTGYPLVDAGMRELWATGYMHNRVRMIVASFLTKDLLIDWRLGADWFLDTLVDADLASNSTNWQWVTGCGADPTPYFRVFNPVLQSQKFDPQGDYIRQWLPELAHLTKGLIHQPWKADKNGKKLLNREDYPSPIIAHHYARIRALGCYQLMKKKNA